jgi:hypothetical protein
MGGCKDLRLRDGRDRRVARRHKVKCELIYIGAKFSASRTNNLSLRAQQGVTGGGSESV